MSLTPTAFTPTVSFNTPGDLSVSYAPSGQQGTYWSDGNFVTAKFSVTFTPTYTNADGAISINGLGLVPAAASPHAFFGAGSKIANGVAHPSMAMLSHDGVLRIGPADTLRLTTADFPTGVAATIEGQVTFAL